MESKITPRAKWLIYLIVLASFLLQVGLAAREGSRFFPDETRYDLAGAFAYAAAHLNISSLGAIIADNPGHAGFTLLMAPVAGLQGLLPEPPGGSSASWDMLPLVVLAAISSASILLIYLIGFRWTASPAVGLCAAAMLAASHGWNAFASHLLPYNLSMAFLLLGIHLLCRERDCHRERPSPYIRMGSCFSAAFLVYNGHWATIMIAGLAVFGWTVLRGGTWTRLAGLVLGFLAPLAFMEALAALAGGSMIFGLGNFAQTVDQGDWSMGGSIPILYAKIMDPALATIGLLWVGSLVARTLWKNGRVDRLEFICLGFIVLLWTVLFTGSNVMEKFVVYGRTVRPMLPVFALGVAAWVGPWCDKALWRSLLLAAGLIAHTLSWYLPALVQSYPMAEWKRLTQMPGFETMGVGFTWKGPQAYPPDDAIQGSTRIFYNYRHLYPLQELKPVQKGTLLWQAPHPAAAPYIRYEGYSQRERELLQTHPPRMMVIEHAPAAPPSTNE